MSAAARTTHRTERTARWAAPDKLADRCPLASWQDHVEALDAHLARTPAADPYGEPIDDDTVDACQPRTAVVLDHADDVIDRLDWVSALQVALGRLNSKQRQVIELRFGLLDGERLTLQQIGDRFGCTRERVRQIEARALAEVRLSFGIATPARPVATAADFAPITTVAA